MTQPIDVLMTRLGLSNADLVRVSTQQLSFKNVQKARTGRRITTNIQDKILTSLLTLKSELKLVRRDLFRYEAGEEMVGSIPLTEAEPKAKVVAPKQAIPSAAAVLKKKKRSKKQAIVANSLKARKAAKKGWKKRR